MWGMRKAAKRTKSLREVLQVPIYRSAENSHNDSGGEVGSSLTPKALMRRLPKSRLYKFSNYAEGCGSSKKGAS